MAETAMELPKAKLVSLPVEVIDIIIEHVGHDEKQYGERQRCRRRALHSLRQTCEQLALIVWSRYVNEYFTRMGFILAHRKSLQAAVEISKHEIFSKTVKHIEFDIRAMTQERRKDLYDEPPTPTDSKKSLARARLEGVRKRKGECPQAAAEYSMILKDQEEMRRAGDDVLLLSEILTNYHEAGSIPSIFLGELECREPAPCGEHDIQKRIGVSCWFDETAGFDNMNGSNYFDHPTAAFFEAVSRSNFPLEKFSVGGPDWNVPLYSFVDALGPLGPTYKFSKAFKNLKSFDISLQHARLYELEEEFEGHLHSWEKHVHSFIQILQAAQNLEHLSIQTPETFEPDEPTTGMEMYIFSSVANKATLPALRKLDIVGQSVDIPEFLDFLGRHRKTMRSLTMFGIEGSCGSELLGGDDIDENGNLRQSPAEFLTKASGIDDLKVQADFTWGWEEDHSMLRS